MEGITTDVHKGRRLYCFLGRLTVSGVGCVWVGEGRYFKGLLRLSIGRGVLCSARVPTFGMRYKHLFLVRLSLRVFPSFSFLFMLIGCISLLEVRDFRNQMVE